MGCQGGPCKIKGSTIDEEADIARIIFHGRLERYALHLFVVPSVLVSYLIFVHTHGTAVRADGPQLICVFLLDLIPGEETTLPIDSR
jgi:hypothetical protein